MSGTRMRLLALARGHWRLAAILALALGLRLLLWSQPPHEPANDEVEYIAVARDLLAGRGWVFYESYRWLRAPLYPLFLAGSLWLAGGDLHLAALPNIALSVLNVYLIYRLALALVGARAALLAALIAASLLTLATFGSLYMAETLFTCLFLGGLLCALRASEERRVRAIAAWSLAAGLFFGLATLTRSITLLFLPLLALWLLFGRTPEQHSNDAGDGAPSERSLPVRVWSFVTRRWVAPALLLGAAALTVAPWTVRNALAYGEPILVETGLSYNLWVFSEPRESQGEIHRTLEGIANPAERADYATARGLELLREDPAIVPRKLWPNWVFLARVKPIQDRFLLESYYQSVDLPLFAAALLLDDLLYVVVALAAIVGLARAASDARSRADLPGRLRHIWPALVGRPVWLMLAWIGYVLLTTLLTHGEARYRHFLFPVLIPYAAAFLAGRSRITGWRTLAANLRSPGGLLVAALWAVFLWTVATSYPRDWALQNVARGWHTLVGDALLAAGNGAGAQRAYERAIAAQSAPDPWLRLGHARRAAGDLAGAAEAYRQGWRREPLYYPASTWYGDALRALGDEERAREAFAGSYADPQRVTDYAWRAIRAPGAQVIDVGGGLDFGYLRGVYPAEVIDGASARWTAGRAELRLEAEAGGVLRLRLAAPRPDQQTTGVSVCASGTCRTLEVGAGWRTYELPLAGGAAPLVVEVRSDTFRGPDGRELGVLIDRAEVE